MRKSPANAQLNLPPAELRASEQSSPSFRNSEQDIEALGKSEQLAATFLNQALDAADLTNKEVAHLCGVSVSLVEKWRSTEARGCPSFVQLLMLPPTFHLELHRAMNRRFGFGRQLLARLMHDISDLALAVDR
jgi:DNA-binding transcriptional regulator YiaG